MNKDISKNISAIYYKTKLVILDRGRNMNFFNTKIVEVKNVKILGTKK